MRNFVVGSSVIGFKYKEGVIIATDTQGSYGSLCKYTDIKKTFVLTDRCILGYSGEISDIQALQGKLEELTEEEDREIHPLGYSRIVQRILYSKRTNMKPMNIFSIIGGVEESGDVVLTGVDHLGNFFTSDVIASGIGAFLALPFLREKVEGRVEEIEREEAIKIMEEAMRILYYRNTRASNKIMFVGVTKEGTYESEAYFIESSWEVGILEGEVVLD